MVLRICRVGEEKNGRVYREIEGFWDGAELGGEGVWGVRRKPNTIIKYFDSNLCKIFLKLFILEIKETSSATTRVVNISERNRDIQRKFQKHWHPHAI